MVLRVGISKDRAGVLNISRVGLCHGLHLRLQRIHRKIAKGEEEIVETQVANLFGTVPVSYDLQQLNLLSGVKE